MPIPIITSHHNYRSSPRLTLTVGSFVLGLLTFGWPAHAQISEVLCQLYWQIIYADVGRGVATLAVCALGVGAMLGKVSWAMAITVGVGVGVLFGAAEITFILVGDSC